jgi:hypothetical protein
MSIHWLINSQKDIKSGVSEGEIKGVWILKVESLVLKKKSKCE